MVEKYTNVGTRLSNGEMLEVPRSVFGAEYVSHHGGAFKRRRRRDKFLASDHKEAAFPRLPGLVTLAN
jgi:hypothetical protein